MSHQAMKLRMLMTQLLNLSEIGLHEMRRKSESDDTRFEAVAMDIDSLEMSTAHRAQTLPSPYRTGDQLAKLRPMLEEDLRRQNLSEPRPPQPPNQRPPSSRLISVQPRPAGSSRTFAVNINSGQRRRRRATIKATTNPRRRERLPCRPPPITTNGCRSTSGCQTRAATPELCWGTLRRELTIEFAARASGDDTTADSSAAAAERRVPMSDELCSSGCLHLPDGFQDWLDFFLLRESIEHYGRLYLVKISRRKVRTNN
uniref:Uncharacterized protein n=1 Tax=Macrostomum lignano TaxID=282301 RepID=A0A1I8FN10_9PLAT